MSIKVTTAKFTDHPEVAKLARRTGNADFTNRIFSSEDVYAKGFILKAMEGKRMVGFIALRHAVRKPYTNIYFLGVDPEFADNGVASELLAQAMSDSPHGTLRAKVEAEYPEDVKLFKTQGFKPVRGEEDVYQLVFDDAKDKAWAEAKAAKNAPKPKAAKKEKAAPAASTNGKAPAKPKAASKKAAAPAKAKKNKAPAKPPALTPEDEDTAVAVAIAEENPMGEDSEVYEP